MPCTVTVRRTDFSRVVTTPQTCAHGDAPIAYVARPHGCRSVLKTYTSVADRCRGQLTVSAPAAGPPLNVQSPPSRDVVAAPFFTCAFQWGGDASAGGTATARPARASAIVFRSIGAAPRLRTGVVTHHGVCRPIRVPPNWGTARPPLHRPVEAVLQVGAASLAVAVRAQVAAPRPRLVAHDPELPDAVRRPVRPGDPPRAKGGVRV